MEIDGNAIAPGEHHVVRLEVARLPTGTLIDLPVHVFRAPEPGPTLLVQGGLHGDEVNGIEICRRLLDTDAAVPDRGTVIVVPVLNVFGFLHFSREVPDGKDVNRSFPGSRKGSLASRVAWTHTRRVLPHVTAAIDLHTGGGRRHNHPQARYTEGDAAARALAETFGASFCFASGLIAKSFRQAAAKRDIPVVVYEAGESMRLHEDSVAQGLDGTRRVMAHLGMLDVAPEPRPTRHLTDTTWLRAPNAGMFSSRCDTGDAVQKGQLLGQVTDPFNAQRENLYAPMDGWVITRNFDAVVHRGDALLRVGA